MREQELEHPKYHGYEYPAPDWAGRFHFGILRFFQRIEHGYYFRVKGDEEPPAWPEKWFDRKFVQAVAKFSDTFHKLDLVAWLLEIERMKIFENKDQREIDKYSKHLHGLRAVPIYLDSLLFYLRILADNIADLTPYLYPVSSGRQIARRSFRDHRKWFIKNDKFDPDYTRIVTNYTDWFDILAGKIEGQGLRDKIIHHRGTFQVSYTTDTEVDEFKLTAGIVGDSGWLVSDIFPELTMTTSKLFLFLDQFLSHFGAHLENKLGESIFDLNNPHHTELFRFNKPLLSFWLFSRVERGET
jgi:hypothetical protein